MDQQGTALAFAGIRDVRIDEPTVRAHVMRPPHVVNMVSSRGLEEGTPHLEFKIAPAPTHHFDVDGFGKALHAALKDSVVAAN